MCTTQKLATGLVSESIRALVYVCESLPSDWIMEPVKVVLNCYGNVTISLQVLVPGNVFVGFVVAESEIFPAKQLKYVDFIRYASLHAARDLSTSTPTQPRLARLPLPANP